ncbi:hypothetical protein PILCRDRAFT_810445 [Piloderma croceum F 1598]|uniref:Helicase ATP-binding domain-containing protein n=1 Tax=Piloderma croceum (strain F 1598) TaxID=765440 RepID=A0A0C3C0M6_PILCF|nr:hypothetical protein PILCRDRAFT_810445 [Piloderma croceum F 1598]
MEEIRRRLAQDATLFPNRDTSPISISSTSSSPAVAPVKKTRAIVISSDEEEEEPLHILPTPGLKHASGSQPNNKPAQAQASQVNSKLPAFNNMPLATRPPNFPGTYPPQFPRPGLPIGNPIHIPSNRAPEPYKGANPTWETFTLQEEGHLYDPQTSAAEAEKALRQLVEDSHNDNEDDEVDMSLAIVEGFKDGITLLPHQVLGRVWMKERETGKKAGGILADDMGLGKTIQTLARIIDGRPKKSDKQDGWAAGTLVVCPVALVSQWASEIQKMCIGLRVIEHHGASRTTDPAKLRQAHVVVTSYSIVASEHGAFKPDSKNEGKGKKKTKAKAKKQASSDSDDDDDDDSADSDSSENFGKSIKKTKPASKKQAKDALFRVKWWRIVLDEAHNIKNRNTKSALACCDLEGKFRWCLTGTPMQNSVEELYSLLKFLQIRPLNDWQTFNEQINKPVKAGRQVRAMKRLHVILKAIMLRRKKDHVLNGKPILQLPERTVEVVQCDFDPEEYSFYMALESKMSTEVDKLMNAGKAQNNYTHVLVMLLRLRQACNHPSLVNKDYKIDSSAIEPKAASKGQEADDDGDDLAAMFGSLGVSNTRRCQVCQTALPSSSTGSHCSDCATFADKALRKTLAGPESDLPPDSAKIRKILELLAKIDERDDEEKTIIFSQFTSMLDLIQPFLTANGIKHVRYDGSMSKDKREASLEKIRNSKSTRVILISFKAGSTGLNLTACNNVILVDLWWNPALEEQAFDRAHRFGQTRDVNIFKLTIEKTVEDRILLLQDKKRELTKAALSGDKMKNNKLGINDLMALFRPGGRDDEEE